MSGGAPRSTVIVTPVYRSRLTEIEHALLARTGEATKHPRVFVAPEGLDVGEIRERYPRDRIETTNPQHLLSVRHYNLWLTSQDFYRMWPDFEWILVSQLDAVLICDPWVNVPDGDPSWDFLGAPWNPPMRAVTFGNRILVRSPSGHDRGPRWVGAVGRRMYVGNGGLSIRRQAAFEPAAAILEAKTSRATRQHTNEDVLWAAFGPRFDVRIADFQLASTVFWESVEPVNLTPQSIPDVTGYHGVDRWSGVARGHVIGELDDPTRNRHSSVNGL